VRGAGGEPVDLGAVKPRARKLLHVLAIHADRSVHREVLIEELWPGTDPDVGARNLHVALSSLRQLLLAEPCSGAVRIVREGTGYRLVPDEGSQIDVVEFTSELDRGRRYLSAGRVEEAEQAFAELMRYYPDLTISKFKQAMVFSPAVLDRYFAPAAERGGEVFWRRLAVEHSPTSGKPA